MKCASTSAIIAKQPHSPDVTEISFLLCITFPLRLVSTPEDAYHIHEWKNWSFLIFFSSFFVLLTVTLEMNRRSINRIDVLINGLDFNTHTLRITMGLPFVRMPNGMKRKNKFIYRLLCLIGRYVKITLTAPQRLQAVSTCTEKSKSITIRSIITFALCNHPHFSRFGMPKEFDLYIRRQLTAINK